MNFGIIYSLLISGSNIFAGTNGYGVYHSTDNGTSWNETELNYNVINSLAISGNNIFAGSGISLSGEGVFMSTNNGTSWTQTTLNNRTVNSLAISGNNIFAGTYGSGVYLSTDNGTSWTQTALNNRAVYSLAISGNNIFAGKSDSSVYISTNNGTSWTQTALNNRNVYSLSISGSNIFAGTYLYGVYISTNNGTSWTQTTLNNRVVNSLAISGNNIFAGTSSYGVYLSTNNGSNWNQWNSGFYGNVNGYGTLSIPSLLIGENNYIFAGTKTNSVLRRFLPGIEVLDLKAVIEGFYDPESNSMNPDTLTIYLREAENPFSIVDTAKACLNPAGQTSFIFNNILNNVGYYIETKHRNGLETWSKIPQIFISDHLSYDFTDSSAKAYGDNMKREGEKWVIYTGDVDRNGFIDLTDELNIYNDAVEFISGYVNSDLNGDNFTDLSDILLAYNNLVSFVKKITPLFQP